MRKLLAITWLCSVTLAFGQFYFEAGPWFRGDMDVTVDGGSRAAEEGIQAASPGTRGDMAYVDPLTPPDDGTAQILREFDDGYVGPSGWGWALSAGQSQYFGYDNASQYNSVANTLTFTASRTASGTGQRTRTDVLSGASGWDGNASLKGAGALATMGYGIASERWFDLSMQVQMGWLDGLNTSFHGQQAWSQNVTWSTLGSRMERSQSWNYVYDTLGNPLFPTAPYAMTDSSGVGPMISDRPTEIQTGEESVTISEEVVGRRQAVAVSRVDLDTEASLLVMAFGPRLRFHPMKKLAFLIQGGVTANLLDAELSRRETFAWENGQTIQSWADHEDEQDWLWGATLSMGLQFLLTQNLYLVVSGGYDWLEPATLTVGPDSVRYDLDGWRADVAVGWMF